MNGSSTENWQRSADSCQLTAVAFRLNGCALPAIGSYCFLRSMFLDLTEAIPPTCPSGNADENVEAIISKPVTALRYGDPGFGRLNAVNLDVGIGRKRTSNTSEIVRCHLLDRNWHIRLRRRQFIHDVDIQCRYIGCIALICPIAVNRGCLRHTAFQLMRFPALSTQN